MHKNKYNFKLESKELCELLRFSIFKILLKIRKASIRIFFLMFTLFYFFLPMYGRESIVFEPNFQNRGFDGFTCFESP